MKDYIDKLREDYHRKQIQKLKFGDKFKAKINDWRYGEFSTPEQEVDEKGNPIVKAENKPKLTNSQMGLGDDKDVIYAPGYEPPVNPFKQEITSSFGEKYHQFRAYKNKNESAGHSFHPLYLRLILGQEIAVH